MGRKISDAELNAIIEKIRKQYDNLIVSYMLDRSLKDGFEQRYFEVRKAGVDPLRFLNDEIMSLKSIENREKTRINKEGEKKIKKNIDKNIHTEKEDDKRDFADRVLEEMMKKIAKYPDIFIHQNANPEIRKLFGALIEFDTSKWQEYENLAKKYRVNRYDPAYTRLENMLNNFTRVYTEDVPARLLQYKSKLSSSFARTKDIGNEEKMCILECAYLIKNLKETAESLAANPEIMKQEKEKLDFIISYLDEMINDFRLKDLMTLNR